MEISDSSSSVDSTVSSKDLAIRYGFVRNPLTPEEQTLLRSKIIDSDHDDDENDDVCLNDDSSGTIPSKKTLSERVSYYFNCFKSKAD